ELLGSIDEIKECEQKVEYLLYIGCQQLRFAILDGKSLPSGMKQSAINMTQIRIKKYFRKTSLIENEIDNINDLTHLGPPPG
ncbi:hypothetical protein, partial [Klebsiella pneumoniae]|uniref:hypothetical protein n=1 Tax=Klebsiella pneumoniae TaxID=573 RepID=UPI003013340F